MGVMKISLTEELAVLCKKWKISRLSIFGSYANNIQNEFSDIDLLVSFEQNSTWSLLDHVRMKKEFESYFQKEVDLLTESALRRMKNRNRKEDISKNSRVIYAA